MKTLYLFDFDGTISKRDSMISYAKFINPFFTFYFKCFFYAPFYFLFILGILKNHIAKHYFLKIFIGPYSKSKLEKFSSEFVDYFKKYIRSSAYEYLNTIDPSNTCVVVSASLDIWLKPIVEDLGLSCICTKAKFKNEKYIGFEINCYGQQKSIRIQEQYDLSQFESIIAFGDSKGDAEMMKLASKKNYGFFKD